MSRLSDEFEVETYGFDDSVIVGDGFAHMLDDPIGYPSYRQAPPTPFVPFILLPEHEQQAIMRARADQLSRVKNRGAYDEFVGRTALSVSEREDKWLLERWDHEDPKLQEIMQPENRGGGHGGGSKSRGSKKNRSAGAASSCCQSKRGPRSWAVRVFRTSVPGRFFPSTSDGAAGPATDIAYNNRTCVRWQVSKGVDKSRILWKTDRVSRGHFVAAFCDAKGRQVSHAWRHPNLALESTDPV